MVKHSMDLLELLRKRGIDGDVDFLREALRVLVDGIVDAEVSAQIGAQHGERSPERVTYRNGYRNRTWDTRVGTMELHIPKLREGSYFPSLLEPRRRSEKALLSVIQQAYVEGVSTRRVDDLIKALGCDGISSSQVSRICEQLDEVVESFLGRPLDGGPYPYVWLDGLTQKVREGGRIVNVCVVVATGVNADGQREILGMDVGASEDGARHHGYTGQRGYHPLLAVAAGTGDVLMARLREGRAITARGLRPLPARDGGTVRYGGARGQLTARADSGCYAHALVAVCREMDVRFSITVRQHQSLHNLIEAIPEEDWTPIPYWMAVVSRQVV